MLDLKILEEAGQEIITYTLQSGIRCYILPKKDFKEKQAMLCVNYGSMDTEFKIDGIKYATPEGTAHFLEHKMFEDEKINVFDEFTKMKANVNAFTNYNMTAYHFSCRENFYENLSLLASFVNTPYFTDENVEKEKDIIIQEIKMYRDVPSWRIFFNMQSKLYKKLPLNKDIAGTEDSVRSIDKDMLYLCYNSFYRPGNMALICTGDVDRFQINDTIEKIIQGKDNLHTEKIYGIENDHVTSDYIEEKMDVSANIFNIGFKDNESDKDKLKLMNLTRILLDLFFGESSQFYSDMYGKGLLDSSFGTQYVSSFAYGTSVISGISNEPERLREEIFKYISHQLDQDLSKRFQQIKKKQMGMYLRNFNSVDLLTNIQADLYLKDLNLIDIIYNLRELKYEDVKERAEKHFRRDNNVLSVIKPL